MPLRAERAHAQEAIAAELLAEFGGFVEKVVGLHFSAARAQDLRRALTALAREAGVLDARRFVASLVSQPVSRGQIEKLAGHVTIGETYFFRDPASFECLERHIVPDLVRSCAAPRRLRVWSAGCSTGEEAYSLAIALRRCLAPHDGWQPSILATDINPRALRKARAGIYDDWSFRATPEPVKREFFRPCGRGRFEMQAAIRSMVELAYLNLAEDPFPSADNGTNMMDIIMCRNVLMYFEPRHALAVLRKFQRALAPGGWLFLSPVEVPTEIPDGLTRVHYPGVIALRKTGDTHRAPALDDPQRPPPPCLPRVSPPAEEAHARETANRARHRPRSGRDDRPRALRSPDGYPQAQREYERGDYARALATLEWIAAAEPGHADTLALIARIRANQGRLDEASAWCEKAIVADKLCPAWPYLLATLLLAQDRVAEASSSLRRALFLDPQHALAHLLLGNIARRQGAEAEAARHLHNALALVSGRPPHDLVDAAEGITAGHLTKIIEAMLAGVDRA